MVEEEEEEETVVERRERERRVENTREVWAFVMTSKMVRDGSEGVPEVPQCLTERRIRTLGQAHCTSAST